MKNKVILLIIPLFLLTGCFGICIPEYPHTIGEKYELERANNSDIVIQFNDRLNSMNDSIGPKVYEVSWNKKYIFAKQHPFEYYTGKGPDTNITNYWIIDMDAEKRMGPFNEEEFNDKVRKLNTTVSKFQNTESCIQD